MTNLGKKPVVVEPEPFNLDNELTRVFKELEGTDPRQDPYRSLKVILLYQAQMIEDIHRMLAKQIGDDDGQEK